jgi:hypothetical protein
VTKTKTEKPKPADAWFAWDDIDNNGDDIVLVEAVPVAWDNGKNLKLERRPNWRVNLMHRTVTVPRTRETALAKYIERRQSDVESHESRAQECKRQIEGAKMLQEKTDAKRSPPIPRP